MNEITRVALENEMDLILAHKQSMRLAELAGLSLAAQTTFATAVSEVSRSSIGHENRAHLTLFVSDKKEKLKFIIAVLEDQRKDFSETKDEGYKYAKRLVPHINVSITPSGNKIEMHYRISTTLRLDDALIAKWKDSLNTDPAVSPYEEIKRKNRQLIEMADKLRASEQQYKTLTDSLPIMIFSTALDGKIIYANQWMNDYTGQTISEINLSKWEQILHPEDFNSVWENFDETFSVTDVPVTRERRVRDAKTGEYRWHEAISIAIKEEDGSIKQWNTFMADIHARKMVEDTLKDNQQLKAVHAELEEKIDQLNHSNRQLEQFAYVTSHDLQEPLRKIGFYSDLLKSKYGETIPEEGKIFFENLINATKRMKLLIQDILAYSTLRNENFITVDLNQVAEETVHDLEIGIREKNVDISVGPLPSVEGNMRQLKQLFENLISNSIKYAQPDVLPIIRITAKTDNENVVISFADNGIGFEEKYIHKMFDLFQRLHTKDKYSGTGIGLAICKKIVDMHSGSVYAKGSPGHGATFMITLPLHQPKPQKNH